MLAERRCSAVLAQPQGRTGMRAGTGEEPGGGHRSLHSSAVFSHCSTSAAAAPAFSEGSSQRKHGLCLGCKSSSFCTQASLIPGSFNDTLQNSQFSLLRLLLLTHPHTTLRIQTRAAALPPLIAFLGQSCRSRNNKTEAKGLSSTRGDGGKGFWKILMK